MATKITFTDDVGIVATASNLLGTYRWHVYERKVAGNTAIYVQREVFGILAPEVKIVGDGRKPRIFFDGTLAQFVLIYDFNEQTWMLVIDETTPPVLQPIQQETVIIHTRVGLGMPEALDVRAAAAASTDSVPSLDAYSAPALQEAVAVAASLTEGYYRVRWLPRSNSTAGYNANIVGFNVWLRRHDTGAIQKLTPVLVPFDEIRLYEYEVPAVAGIYMVTQVERKGRNSTTTAESRLGNPKDEVRPDRPLLPTVIRSIMGRKYGEGFVASPYISADYDVVTFPSQSDTFPSHYGEGFQSTIAITADYDVIGIPEQFDTFPSHYGEGFTSRLNLTGYGSIIIG